MADIKEENMDLLRRLKGLQTERAQLNRGYKRLKEDYSLLKDSLQRSARLLALRAVFRAVADPKHPTASARPHTCPTRQRTPADAHPRTLTRVHTVLPRRPPPACQGTSPSTTRPWARRTSRATRCS